eukprot:CAMPEP_0206471676 /NCGR_PEP_ID=MMETSP0324_2-20121206/31716_1 /ASSEMBLY_ACC=CAM_ASM_000836 /TAXON_ID=2866 /ORGANISM="Crypthecodinium cohnii, Strain Seligo" /LENGTH=77 /DNA_ID=CAMNT_0053946069 /DNA_START=229 /DNA_END=462 /DNA_ORIENTATION=-
MSSQAEDLRAEVLPSPKYQVQHHGQGHPQRLPIEGAPRSPHSISAHLGLSFGLSKRAWEVRAAMHKASSLTSWKFGS